MSKMKYDWLKDYQEFLNSEKTEVPTDLQLKTLGKIQSLIKPSAWLVFLKLLGIHVVVGFLSLSICHQFGLNPFNTQSSLADWFMTVGGHNFCMVGCGVMFVSVSVLTAGYFFTLEEARALRKNNLLHNIALGVISLGLFTAFGAQLALGIAGLWLLGSLIGGLLSMSAVFKVKGLLTH